MMALVRTTLFMVVFYGCSVPMVLGAPIAALFGQEPLRRYVLKWLEFHHWVVGWTIGIRTSVTGSPIDQPAFYAAKHQAMFETFELARILQAPSIVMKAELARIPIWGWAARRYGVIVIDRDSSAGALRQMMREGRAAVAAGRSVVIFPEGTRVKPGETPPLKSGFTGLYKALGVPVVPVALETGKLWPKHGPKLPGTVEFAFGKPIPPNVPRPELEMRVHAAINAFEPLVIRPPEIRP